MAVSFPGDWTDVLVVAGVAFGASVLGGLSGYGAGSLVAPAVLPVFGEKAVFPVIVSAMLLGNLSRSWVYRKAVEFPTTVPIVAAVLPGIAAGTIIYGALPEVWLSMLIGIALLATIPARRIMAGRAMRPSRLGLVLACFAAGVISGNAPGGGIIIISILLGLGMRGAGLLATDAVIGVAVCLGAMVMFAWLGLLTPPLAMAGFTIGAAMVPGAFVARWLLLKLPLSLHVVVLEALVAASGVVFLWNGAAAL